MPAATATRRKKTTRKTTTKKTTPASTRRGSKPVTPDDVAELVGVADPRMAPDGSCIVFARSVVGQKKSETVRNLWMVAAEGGEPTQFTSGERDGKPRFSPDGTRIAFVRAAEKTKPQVHLISLDGGEARPLTCFDEGTIGSFKWSPTGRHIALTFRPQDPD